MMHVGSFCQLAKLFMPSYRVLHDWSPAEKEEAAAKGVQLPPHRVEFVRRSQLLAEPSRITAKERFVLSVPRSHGMVEFVVGQPLPVADQSLAMWLTGGPQGEWSRETDWTGLASVELTPEHQGRLLQAQLNNDFEAIREIQGDLIELRKKAEELSATRVRRQLEQVMRSMKAQIQACREAKIQYTPSEVERVCVLVLEKELESERETNRQADEAFARTFENVAGMVS